MAEQRPIFNIKPSPEVVEAAIAQYFADNPTSTTEPLLAAHLADPTPHPVYDNLSAGRFITYLQNGMA